MLFQYLLHRGNSQPRAEVLGCKQRFANFRKVVCRNARSVVSHADFGAAPRQPCSDGNDRRFRESRFGIIAFANQCFRSIGEQVDNGAFKSPGFKVNKFLAKAKIAFDRNQIRQFLRFGLDQLFKPDIKNRGLGLDCLGPGKIEQLGDDVVAADDTIVDALLLRLNAKPLVLDLARQKICRGSNRAEGISKFVGDSCRQIAKLCHLALAERLVLGFAQLGDVISELPVERTHLAVDVLDLMRKRQRLFVR